MPPGHAEALKAAGMSPGPCSEANPILVGSKASSKPIFEPSEVIFPPGRGDTGSVAQYGSKIQGNTVFQKSLLGCPAQKPEQVEQTPCSLGKPLSRETPSGGNGGPMQGYSSRGWCWSWSWLALQRLEQGHQGGDQAGVVTMHGLRFSPAGPGRHSQLECPSGGVCPLAGLELLFGML